MSCCLIIILVCIALCVMVAKFIFGLIAFDIIFFILFLASIGKWKESKKIKPSKMICQNCNSTNVKLSTRESGKTMTGSRYGYSVSGRTTIHYSRIAECKDCGFVWDYIIKEDIEKAKTNAKNAMVGYGFIFAILIIFTLWILL